MFDFVVFGLPVPNLVKVMEKSNFLKENEEEFAEIRSSLERFEYKKIFSMAASFERKKMEGKKREEGRGGRKVKGK